MADGLTIPLTRALRFAVLRLRARMRGERRRLILHIGTQKTGSTSFQGVLERHEDLLRSRGVWPWRDLDDGRGQGQGRGGMNAGFLADCVLRDEVKSIPRLKGLHGQLPAPERARLLARAARDIARLPHRDVVVSAEAFAFLRTREEQETMRRFIAATGRTAEVLVVFRDPASWQLSWEGEAAKDAGVAAANAIQPPGTKITDAWYYDRKAIETFWRSLAPVSVLEYDGSVNIVAALCEAAGISTDGLETALTLNRSGDGGA